MSFDLFRTERKDPVEIEDVEENEILSGQSEQSFRDGRFLLYFRTTSLISTSTTYTGTSKLATLECTPSFFTVSSC